MARAVVVEDGVVEPPIRDAVFNKLVPPEQTVSNEVEVSQLVQRIEDLLTSPQAQPFAKLRQPADLFAGVDGIVDAIQPTV